MSLVIRFHIFILSPSLCATADLRADDRLEKLPGYERYKLVSDNLDKLATGGPRTPPPRNYAGNPLPFPRHHHPKTYRVTTTGTKKFRDGRASWVYGEELDQTDAMWWAPDSSKLAFYEFDERLVKDLYLLRGWSDLRTEPETEGYPKPGEPNPIAGILV